jgi:hypothetical protein
MWCARQRRPGHVQASFGMQTGTPHDKWAVWSAAACSHAVCSDCEGRCAWPNFGTALPHVTIVGRRCRIVVLRVPRGESRRVSAALAFGHRSRSDHPRTVVFASSARVLGPGTLSLRRSVSCDSCPGRIARCVVSGRVARLCLRLCGAPTSDATRVRLRRGETDGPPSRSRVPCGARWRVSVVCRAEVEVVSCHV